MSHSSPFLRAEKENMVILKSTDVLEDGKSAAECCKPVPYQYHNCYGLPYQDHNYGAPPPPTPPQSPGKATLPAYIGPVGTDEATTGSLNSEAPNEVDKISGNAAPGTSPIEVAITTSVEDSVTRCICEFSHDDGYMICCDECSVWQHIDCMGISRDKIPETYLCEQCLPRKVYRQKARLIQKRKRDELLATGSDEDKSKCRRRRPQQQGRKLNGSGSGNHCAAVTTAEDSCQGPVGITQCSERKSTRINGSAVKQVVATVTPSRKDSIRRRQRSTNEDSASPEHAVKRKRNSRSIDATNMDDDSIMIDPCELSGDVATNIYDPEVEELVASKKLEDHGSIQLDEKNLLSLRMWVVRSLPYGRKCLEAQSAVKAETVLLTYQGRFMLRDQFLIENPETPSRCSAGALFFNYAGMELCVVAALGDAGGSDARFIRRSCTPNAEVRHAVMNGKLHLVIVATQEMFKGTEITIPFDGHADQCDSSCECACGRGSACLLKKGCGRRLRRKAAPGSSCTTKEACDQQHAKHDKLGLPLIDHPQKRERRDSLKILIPMSPPLQGALSPSAEGVHGSSCTSGEQPLGDVLSPGGSCDKTKVALSREERKVAAIVKAFEKLEKREERRKEALARLEHSKKVGGCTGGQQSPGATAPGLSVHDSPAKAAALTVKDEKDGEPSEQSLQAATRRRSATGSALERAKECRRNRRVSESHHAADRDRCSDGIRLGEHCVDTPEPAVNAGVTSATTAISSHNPLVLPSEIGSTSYGTLSPTYARLPKTKKHLLSEWYHETGCDKPLLVQTENTSDESRPVRRCSVLSPGTAPASPQLGVQPKGPFQSAVGWSPQAGTPGTLGRALPCGSSTTTFDGSMGSAKKRWLRQAMTEGGDHSENSNQSLFSPLSGMQPLSSSIIVPSLPGICRALLCATTCTATTVDVATSHVTPTSAHPIGELVAPPKKRRLARESISMDDQNSMPSPSNVSATVLCSRPASPSVCEQQCATNMCAPCNRSHDIMAPATQHSKKGVWSMDSSKITNSSEIVSPSADHSCISAYGDDAARDMMNVCSCEVRSDAERPSDNLVDAGLTTAVEWVHHDSHLTSAGSNGLDVSDSSCAAELLDGLNTPAKKKVSLLEYRKRMKVSGDECHTALSASSGHCTSPPQHTFSDSENDQSLSASLHPMPISLPPLPLFNNMPATDQARCGRRSSVPIAESQEYEEILLQHPALPWHAAFEAPLTRTACSRSRKPVSLDERLRLEFGLEDDEAVRSPASTSHPTPALDHGNSRACEDVTAQACTFRDRMPCWQARNPMPPLSNDDQPLPTVPDAVKAHLAASARMFASSTSSGTPVPAPIIQDAGYGGHHHGALADSSRSSLPPSLCHEQVGR